MCLCLLASWTLFVNISISLTPPIFRDITKYWNTKLAITNLLITAGVSCFTKAFFSPDRLISLCCLYSQEEISVAKFGAETQHSSALNNSGESAWLQGVSRDSFPGLQESLHYTHYTHDFFLIFKKINSNKSKQIVMQRTKMNKRRELLISCFPAEKMRKGWRISPGTF